jgi:protein FAM32A
MLRHLAVKQWKEGHVSIITTHNNNTAIPIQTSILYFIDMTKSSFMGGSLSFKGDKKKSKKKRTSKHKKIEDAKKQAEKVVDSDEDEMTEAEKRALKFKMERQRQESETIASKSHRERVEELNEMLGNLTEHNDIPRVSAAGNG